MNHSFSRKHNLPIFENVKYVSFIIDGDKETSRPSVYETESLARQTHGGSVNDWQILLYIL